MKARFASVLVLAAALALVPLSSAPAARADNPEDTAGVSSSLIEEGGRKAGLQDALHAASSVDKARLGEAIDPGQVSVGALVERGNLQLTPDTQAAFAYIQPYQEPDDFAHRNYCGPGAAIALLSHWDPNLPNEVNIDQLGSEMGLDPNAGMWVYQITRPVNNHLNGYLGQDINWYHYGEARSLADFRYIVNVDIQQNGVPFITALDTYGLPGWGSRNVGHIIAVYGYSRTSDGTEYVNYADTASPNSGYYGLILNQVELGTFWGAVSGNSAQVW